MNLPYIESSQGRRWHPVVKPHHDFQQIDQLQLINKTSQLASNDIQIHTEFLSVRYETLPTQMNSNGD